MRSARGLAVGMVVVLCAGGTWGLAALSGAHGRPLAGAGRPLAADLPGVAERLAVEQYCTGGGETLTALREPDDGSGTSGTVLTDTGAYVADIANALAEAGADQASATPSPTPVTVSRDAALHDPMGLVRSQGPASVGWRSRSAVLPQQVGYSLRQPVVLDRAAFWQTSAMPPESWARDVALLVSTAAPDGEFRMAGRWTLRRTTAVQTFSFVAVRARYVRLCMQTRYGDADFVSLGGVSLGVLTGTVVPDSRPLGPVPPGVRRTSG